MTIKTLVADDHEVVRTGLRAIFKGSDIRVVAEASDGNEALKLAKKHRPNLVLLNVHMPNGDGLSCLAHLKLKLPQIPVVMFSSTDSSTHIARALALGAAGFLLKSSPCNRIVNAIQAAASGRMIWSKNELRHVTGALMPGGASHVPFTNREGQVLKQLAFGLTNKEIAQTLGIGAETVKEHVQHILKKLNVSHRTQAAVWAVRNNLA